jgi:hypothetical protein
MQGVLKGEPEGEDSLDDLLALLLGVCCCHQQQQQQQQPMGLQGVVQIYLEGGLTE